MGVTTLVTGNCGGSVVDVGRFLARASETPLAVNIATLVGHGSVRESVMGEVDRAPTPEELEKMKALVGQAMQDGAVGLSTGLIYVPGTYAKTDEVVELARVVARHGGVYATHMRSEGEHVREAIRESIEIGEKAGLPVEISHFKISMKKLWGQSDATLGLVREARARGLSVTVDQYAYTASSTSLDSRLPVVAARRRARGREEAPRRPDAARARRPRDEGLSEEERLQGLLVRGGRQLPRQARVQRQVHRRDHEARARQERHRQPDRAARRDVRGGRRLDGLPQHGRGGRAPHHARAVHDDRLRQRRAPLRRGRPAPARLRQQRARPRPLRPRAWRHLARRRRAQDDLAPGADLRPARPRAGARGAGRRPRHLRREDSSATARPSSSRTSTPPASTSSSSTARPWSPKASRRPRAPAPRSATRAATEHDSSPMR